MSIEQGITNSAVTVTMEQANIGSTFEIPCSTFDIQE